MVGAPAIVVVPSKPGDGAYYEAKWRGRDGRQVKRRVGRAWVERDGGDGWRKRRGRTPTGWLDPRTVPRRGGEMVKQVQREHDEAAKEAARAAAITFRRACERGDHHATRNYRGRAVDESPEELAARAAEDQQDAARSLMFFSGRRTARFVLAPHPLSFPT